MDWKQKRRRDLLAQKKYAEDHPWCEICLAEGRGKVRARSVHEIIYRSGGGKCIPDNMISACGNCHQRCHFLRKSPLNREDLWKIKNLDIEKMQEELRGIRKGRKEL